jgi:uncharacterized protein
MRIVAVVILGSLMGVVFERFRLCMSSAMTDSVLLGDRTKLRGLLFGVLVSAAAFNALIGAGVMKPVAEPLSPMTAVAGVVFGIGMTLAGGCVSGTLFKVGQGYVASLLAFLGLVTGFGTMGYLMQFMTRPWEESRVPQWTKMTLPEVLEVSPILVAIPAAMACAALIWLWKRGGTIGRRELDPVVGAHEQVNGHFGVARLYLRRVRLAGTAALPLRNLGAVSRVCHGDTRSWPAGPLLRGGSP